MQQLQVTVTHAKGAVEEPESIVSIRAASSRRQGVVQLKRALHFPVPMADATPFKVDVLRKVGEGEVTVRAEDADYNCAIKKVGSPDTAMNLKLAIRAAPHLCGRSRQELKVGASAPLSTNVPEAPIKELVAQPPVAADLTAAPAWPELQQGAAVQARQYFDNHNIMRLVQALLEALIRDQPQEPFSYIGTFMDRLSEALQQKPGVKAGDDALEGGTGPDSCAVAREQYPEWTAIFDANQKQGVVGVDDFCTAIRSVHPQLSKEQGKALCKGIARGDTGVNLAGFCAAANSVAEGNAMAAEVAGMSAAKFAELGTATEARDMTDVRSQMRSLLVESLEDGRLERSLSANAFEKVREKAAETLSMAAKDGTLEQALESIKKVPPPDEQVPENPPPPVGPQAVLETQEEVDQTRQKVKAALVQACDDGRLHTTLRELWQNRVNKDVNQEELEKIREKARSMLLESAANGRLHAELSSIKNGQQDVAKQAELEKTFGKLRDVLTDASNDGRLEAAVKTVTSSEVAAKDADRLEDLKRQASDTLTKAFYDGRLADALESSKKSRQGVADFEQVRLKTKQMLTVACEDGSLEKALSEAAAEAAGEGPEEEKDVADMVRNLLVSAAMDGRLEESLNKMADPELKASGEDSPMDHQPLDFHFDRLLFCTTDEEAFKKEFMESLQYDVPVDTALLSRLVVVLREGSVIARVHGPESSMSVLRSLPLEGKVKVQGEYARIEQVDSTASNGDFMDLQSRALSALVSASKDGSLQDALTSVRTDKPSVSPTDELFDLIDTDKDNMISRSELKQAIKSGALTASWTAPATAPAQATSRDLPADFFDPLPADERRNPQDEVEMVKKKAKEALVNSAMDGTLRDALAFHTQKDGAAPAQPSKPKRPAEEVNAVKQKAKNALTKSAMDGSLREALASCKAPSAPAQQTKPKTRDRMSTAGDDGMAAVASRALPEDKYLEVRQLAGNALVQAVKEGRLETAVRPQPRRSSGTRLTDGMDFSSLPGATGSTAPAPPSAPSDAKPAASAASSAAQSSRHADLLVKQRALLEQKQAYEAQLAELKAKKGLQPVPPSGKPSSKRPQGATITYRDLKEVNSGLCSENARLNAEMARLLARLADAGKA